MKLALGLGGWVYIGAGQAACLCPHGSPAAVPEGLVVQSASGVAMKEGRGGRKPVGTQQQSAGVPNAGCMFAY